MNIKNGRLCDTGAGPPQCARRWRPPPRAGGSMATTTPSSARRSSPRRKLEAADFISAARWAEPAVQERQSRDAIRAHHASAGARNLRQSRAHARCSNPPAAGPPAVRSGCRGVDSRAARRRCAPRPSGAAPAAHWSRSVAALGAAQYHVREVLGAMGRSHTPCPRWRPATGGRGAGCRCDPRPGDIWSHACRDRSGCGR